MIRIPFIAALGMALTFMTSASIAFEIEHNQGTLTLDQTPQRLVSFDLAHLDTLNALDIEVVGVPKSVYSGSLEAFNDAPVVGTLFEPDYETLAKQYPDLIIAGGRSAKAMPKLATVAPTIDFYYHPSRFLDSVKESSLAIGQAWGKKEQAQQAYDDLLTQVDALHAVNDEKTGAMLFIMKDNVIPHAPGDRFGYAYELTGLEAVLPAREPDEVDQPRPQPGTPEAAAAKRAAEVSKIAEADPDWLIVLDRGAINNGEKTASKTLAAHPELSNTTAFQQGRVYYTNPNSWYVVTGGLNNLKAITADMIQAMQK